MTRYARAHGSKASNERTPEEATSWATMKQQLIDSKYRKNDPLENRDVTSPTVIKRYASSSLGSSDNKLWQKFDNDECENTKDNNVLLAVPKKMKKKSLEKKVDILGKSKSKKVHVKGNSFTITSRGSEDFSPSARSVNHVKLKKNEQVSLITGSNFDAEEKKCFLDDRNNYSTHKLFKQSKQAQNKKEKKQQEGCLKSDDCHSESDTENIKNNIIKSKISGKSGRVNDQNADIHRSSSSKMNHKKIKLNQSGSFNFSRYHNHENVTINVGGRAVEISDFRGFAVKKEDAQRLYNLRKDMLSKGVPRKEVEVALKAERRRAEKALAREKKAVCYKCRKFGHNMSVCPELEDSSGICFKCGSTEHSVRDCRVVQSESFRYAHCFICQEQGHIARQCPDNPRGLYPKGGSCKVCGDVTHLKKDCPDLVEEKEKNTITIGTVKNSDIEMLDEDLNKDVKKVNSFKKTSYVKF